MKKATTTVIAATMVGALGLGIGATTLASADTTPAPIPSSAETQADREPTRHARERPNARSGDVWKRRHSERHRHFDHAKHRERMERHRRWMETWRGASGASDFAEKLGVSTDELIEALKRMHESFRPDGVQARDDFTKALADELGVDESKVTEAFEEIVKDRRAAHMTSFKERIQKAVDDGALTQAEGDAVIKAAEKGIIGMHPGPRR